MTNTAISVENLSKSYRLGQIGTGTFAHDLNVWWARIRGKPNPMLRIGEADHGNRDGEEIWALRDINFTVKQGEVLGIIGKNGAGKSTLLKILSRVTAPTSGKIKIKGRIASLLEVGTGFHPEMTGRENVYLNGAIMGMTRKEIDGNFDEIIDFSGVDQFIDTPVKRYSSGMYVRLAFAVAAHMNPEILVVDEVLAVGDAEFQQKCLGKMGEVAKEGRTVLFVSHNMGAIQSLCQNSLLIDEGLIVGTGKSEVIVTQYLGLISLESRTIFRTSNKDDHLWLEQIELKRNGVEPASIIQTGDHLTIHLVIKLSKPFTRLYVGVDLLDEWERLIFAFHSKEAGLIIYQEIYPELNVEIDIPQLFLLPGQFHFRVVVADRDGQLVEDVPRAVSFDIVPRDYSTHGYTFNNKHGQLFIPFRIKMTSGKNVWANEVEI
ncbi:MAG: ABC transporter ATP-binding protein [Chloroflexi bacterium]|nr:ABC transporter ATP-binding protein [Chloroflexota bacterium]